MGGFIGPASQGGTPAVTTLADLALAAGATHCWLGAADPEADLVGGADLVSNATQRQLPPIPPGVEGLLVSHPDTTGQTGPVTAATITIHRNADRTFTWLGFPCAEDTWSNEVLLGLGLYDDADGLCQIRAGGSVVGLNILNPSWSGSGQVIAANGTWEGRWLLITGFWDASAQQWDVWISIDGAAEAHFTYADSTTRNSGTCAVQLGYTSETYSEQLVHGHLALYDGDASAVRLEMYTALGWTDAA